MSPAPDYKDFGITDKNPKGFVPKFQQNLKRILSPAARGGRQVFPQNL